MFELDQTTSHFVPYGELMEAIDAEHRFSMLNHVNPYDVQEYVRDEGSNDGLMRGALELVRTPGIILQCVKIDDEYVAEETDGRQAHFDISGTQLAGFNTHGKGGGTESAFKILVDSADGQRVLYSPPTPDGDATNTQFLHANFNMLGALDPNRPSEFENALHPAIDKVDSNSRHFRGLDTPVHLVLTEGIEDPRAEIVNALEQSGFDFEQWPTDDDGNRVRTRGYGSRIDETSPLHHIRSTRQSGLTGEENWPLVDLPDNTTKHMFADQLDNLQELVERAQEGWHGTTTR